MEKRKYNKYDSSNFLNVLNKYAPLDKKKRRKILLNKPSQFIKAEGEAATSSLGLNVRKNNFSDVAPELEEFTISNRLQ